MTTFIFLFRILSQPYDALHQNSFMNSYYTKCVLVVCIQWDAYYRFKWSYKGVQCVNCRGFFSLV